MTAYTWIVFDADGTLFDFEHAEQSALARTLGHFGIRLTPEIHLVYDRISAELWARFEAGDIDSQRLRVERFELLIDRCGLDARPADVSDHYIESLGSENRLLSTAQAVVERLAVDFRLLLATNGIADVQRRRFECSSIRPCFDDIVISDEIGAAKPDPEFFDQVFARTGQPGPDRGPDGGRRPEFRYRRRGRLRHRYLLVQSRSSPRRVTASADVRDQPAVRSSADRTDHRPDVGSQTLNVKR